MSGSKVYAVTELNLRIKSLIEADPALAGVFVRGEISNYKMYPSGHHYFTLKDAESTLRCVLFKREAARLRFRPENGMKVIALGRVAVYPRDGGYQLYCSELAVEGAGDLHVAFEQLKEKLLREGLFDKQYKKPLPKYPERIAVITSSAGAAVRDIIRILGKRYPLAKVILLPVRVQGAEAPGEICAAIKYADRHKLADVIITGRGGGSIEDLWAFNDENVARAIFACATPVISAVGHEPDFTISDFVADVRAATPSNAAELAVPDQAELYETLKSCSVRMFRAVKREIDLSRREYNAYASCRVLRSPLSFIEDKRIQLDLVQSRLAASASSAIAARREGFTKLAATLDAISPLKVLGRGYSIAERKDGAVIRSVSDIKDGDGMVVRVSDGTLSCTVEGREYHG